MDKHDNTSLFGAFITVISSLNLSDWGVILGILFGLLTILMNWHYKAEELKIKKEALRRYKINLQDIINDEQKR